MNRIRSLAMAAGVTAALLGSTVAEARSYTFTVLATQAGGGDGGGINRRGHAAFTLEVGSDLHAAILRGHRVVDFGVGGALAINDADQLAGFINTPDFQRHAAVWLDGTITDLGTFGGTWAQALGINNHGVVVGVYENG